MSELPTIERVLEAIDRLPVGWTRPAGDDAGRGFVSWQALAYDLFPKGSPHWRRPTGQPHGRDQSPAYAFMESLGFNPAIQTVRISGVEYFAKRL